MRARAFSRPPCRSGGGNTPDPTTGSEPESKDPVKDAERISVDTDKAAADGLA